MSNTTSDKTFPAFARWQLLTLSILLALVLCVALGEWAGWPFLEKPLENFLTKKLERSIRFSGDASTTLNKNASATQSKNKFSIRFIGGVTLKSSKFTIGAPSWSQSEPFLSANNINLKLRYIDLWHAYHNEPLRIERLQAASLNTHLERLADGKASWQFNKKVPTEKTISLPSFGLLDVKEGVLTLDDALLESKIDAQFSLNNIDQDINNKQPYTFLKAHATGYYHKLPLIVEMASSGAIPINTKNPGPIPIALTLEAKLGKATLTFKGHATDALHPSDFAGDFDLKGPSLAAVGDLFDITLPTTSEFNASGYASRQGTVWGVKLNKLDIGASHLKGDFKYVASSHVADGTAPLLTGTLGGQKLLLTDLGPALGADPTHKKKAKVLPTRPFDLASLRKMDADVHVDIKYVDMNTHYLEPLQPLRGHLELKNGILTLKDLDAETAQGQLSGDMRLDGQGKKALWDANLRWKGVRLERWIKQVREDGLPPYISGKLNGKTELKG